jgi:uncharacterized membrane protein YgcG
MRSLPKGRAPAYPGSCTSVLKSAPFLIIFGLWIWAFIDCLLTPEEEVKHLPKAVWVIIILLFGEVLVGPVAWLLAGRPRGAGARRQQMAGPFGTGAPRPAGLGPDEPSGRRVLAPDDDPEFLASLGKHNQQHEDMLKRWESDLRRREEELRRNGEAPEDDEPGSGGSGSGGGSGSSGGGPAGG